MCATSFIDSASLFVRDKLDLLPIDYATDDIKVLIELKMKLKLEAYSLKPDLQVQKVETNSLIDFHILK